MDGIHHRAGRYVEQPEGYRAFLPVPLPPSPSCLWMMSCVPCCPKLAMRSGGWTALSGFCRTPTSSRSCTCANEAVLSSQVEGTQSSLLDLLAAEAKIVELGQPRDVEEVIDYVGADELRFGAS